MNVQKFTQKSLEAIQKAQDLAVQNQNSQIEEEHLILALLEQEDTKLWHFSPLTLFNMFDEEKKTGNFTFPEEA